MLTHTHAHIHAHAHLHTFEALCTLSSVAGTLAVEQLNSCTLPSATHRRPTVLAVGISQDILVCKRHRQQLQPGLDEDESSPVA